MSNLALVAVGYNRPKSLQRLLESLTNAIYDGDAVPLIISIDQSGNSEVESIAKEFNWPYGEKVVVIQPERLGLRRHILQCGDYALQYGAVALLEDDLFVSPYFYRYLTQAIQKYKDEESVAGISLYSHLWNVNSNRPFIPMDDGMDGYFFQFAQSWGQVWTARMWLDFKCWYEQNNGMISNEDGLPKAIIQWPESSWLKYYIKYIVQSNKFFVYPRASLTTNFGDIGQHAQISSTSYQVPLLYGKMNDFSLPAFDKESLKYDVYFERIGMGKTLGFSDQDLCVDLHGEKGRDPSRRYWLTMEIADYHILSSYGLQLRPHEMNVITNNPGKEIFLYDTRVIEGNPYNRKRANLQLLKSIYDIRDIRRQEIIRLAYYQVYSSFKRRVRRIFR
ncbi:glycosyltransferase [Paenibacillus terrigena]|uniref:glycosyltransferase n=1 Tax=Paenibacillus terrigena TaxID=369333 RepID=UPI00037354E9|nr:glycosyltransferase [Paenibacillus terrigena]